jgi:hypothetical protein
MTRRDTLQCVHEPFGDAYYFGPERLAERYEDDEKSRIESGYADSTYKTIFDRIAKEGSEVGLFSSIVNVMPPTVSYFLSFSRISSYFIPFLIYYLSFFYSTHPIEDYSYYTFILFVYVRHVYLSIHSPTKKRHIVASLRLIRAFQLASPSELQDVAIGRDQSIVARHELNFTLQNHLLIYPITLAHDFFSLRNPPSPTWPCSQSSSSLFALLCLLLLPPFSATSNNSAC